jgi:hypothetical protein
MGLDTKTYWLTDRQSHCEFDFDFGLGYECSHGKLVVKEELEVSLWRFSVWLEDLVTMTLF